MSKQLRRRIDRLECERRRPDDRYTLVVYENGTSPTGCPNPTPEQLADPRADIVRVVYVDDWPPKDTR